MNKFYPFLGLICLLIIASCKYTEKVRDGRTAYERMQFAEATKMLSTEYNKTKSRVEKGKIAFMLAESYKRINESKESISWYKTAYDNNFGDQALKEYAFALKRDEQYNEAMEAFKNLGIEIGSPYEYRREIEACKNAVGWYENIDDNGYTVELMDLNNGDSDYAPTVYKDNQLVFTSDRNASAGEENYKWTGNKFSDLYIADLNGNYAKPFDAPINTSNNEGTATFNFDYTEIIFSRCYNDDDKADSYCQLMSSRLEGDTWTEPEKLSFIEPNVNYAHPSLSDDGSTLYFSSNHSEGWGGYDLYTSERTPDGWDQPRLMSRSINTTGDEKFPFIDADTLYFSSDYHVGMGGLDVFRTYKMNADSWSPIRNLKAPINSGADDFGFVVDYNNSKEDEVMQMGYLTSSRDEGKGNDDIYKFERRKVIPPPPPPKPVEDTIVEQPKPPVIVYKMILKGFVLEKIYENPDNPNSRVKGRRPLDAAKVSANFGSSSEKFTVGPDGQFTMELDENTDYSFFASRANYLNNTGRFSTRGIGKDPENPIQEFEIEIVLDKIFKNKEITLENIYYDYDKSDIRLDAQPTLNELTALLSQNPTIKIQLSSHTDCRGNPNYNQNLSQRRAQSAVDYLISKGIASDRVTAKGYGKNAPAIDCACARCSEEEHQANRRTTFKIIE